MEDRDMKLIAKYSSSDKALSSLYQEHLDYERELDELENKSYLTTNDEIRLRELKKKKLMGRDQMEAILRKYRAAEKSA